MDRLTLERHARFVLSALVDSGELQTVESQRSVALRVGYLPPRIRLELPPMEPWLAFLDPRQSARALDGLRQAILRVVEHEEPAHWVVVDTRFRFDVSIREGASRPRVTPVYEEEPPDAAHGPGRLGEPRLRLAWEEGAVVLRAGEGLRRVDLGPRAPAVVMLEAPPEDVAVAWLYSDGPLDVETDDERFRVPPRRRLPVAHDVTVVARPPRLRPWKRSVRCEVTVLGLARMGRTSLSLTRDGQEPIAWERNARPTLELEEGFSLHAGERDHIEVRNESDQAAFLLWRGGERLVVPAGSRVEVQGGHLDGLETPLGIVYGVEHASPAGAPPVHLVHLVGVAAEAPPRVGTSPVSVPAGGRSLFRFEGSAAEVLQEGVVLTWLDAAQAEVVAEVVVGRPEHAGPLAEVALDGCPGAKVRRLGPDAADADTWRHVRDVVPLLPSKARLEVLGTPQVTFAAPKRLRSLTTDAADQLVFDGWRISLLADGLKLTGKGAAPVDIDGVTYHGETRLPFQEAYRVRAGAGVYRILRAGSAREG